MLTDTDIENVNYSQSEVWELKRRHDIAIRALVDIQGSAYDCGERYQTAKEAASWMQEKAGETLARLDKP